MISPFVTGTHRIEQHDVQVGPQEREIVVAAIPYDDRAFPLGKGKYRGIIDTRVDDGTALDMGLVLLALLDSAMRQIEIRAGGEALHPLCLEITVGHRVADHRAAEAEFPELPDQPARHLRFAATGAHRGYRQHRSLGVEHRVARSEKGEIRTARQHPGGGVHGIEMTDVAVGKDHFIDGAFADQLLEKLLVDDGDPFGVERSCQRCREAARGDTGDLRRGKRHYLDLRFIAKYAQEIMKVAARRAHDRDTLLSWRHVRSPLSRQPAT